jgi:hypothetical protein
MPTIDLAGRWEWTESRGGIAGIRRTRSESGSTWTLEFDRGGVLRESRNGSTSTTTYAIEPRADISDPRRTEPALVVPGELDRIIERPDGRTLVLRDNVVDGFTHRFERARQP